MPMSASARNIFAEPATSKVVVLHLGRLGGEPVCDPCIATATGLPLAAVARTTAHLIEWGGYTGWTASCPRCAEVRPLIRPLAAWSRGAMPAPGRARAS
jgi:hypothetical protein